MSKVVAWRDLVLNLAVKDIKVRYMGAALGFAWSLGNPLVVTLTYLVIFTYVLPSGQDRFPLHLVTGILHWSLFSQLVQQSCDWLLQNANLLRKTRFPRVSLPIAGTLTVLALWMAALLVYLVLFPVLGGRPSAALLAYPPLLIGFVAFAAGIGLMLAVGNVYARDLRHVVEVLLPVLFWLTPIVWTFQMVPEHLRGWFYLNPLMPFFNAFSAILHGAGWPASGDVLLCTTIGAVTLLMGSWLFARTGDHIVEHL